MEQAYIVAGVRTAIGSFGGSLKSLLPAELGARVIGEAVRRAQLQPSDVEHVVMGQVIQSSPKDSYLARVAAVSANIPVEVPSFTLNRLCGSGLQAIISAAQMIALGDCDIAVAGGAESMSQSPHVVTEARFGKKMGSITMSDALLEVLSDPFDGCHMGVTAENVAREYGVSREDQDNLALQSQLRAARAQSAGFFRTQIVAIEVKDANSACQFNADEHIRPGATLDELAKLRPAFASEGTVTPGNASGINDGAAAVVLLSGRALAKRNLAPMAKIRGWGFAGVDPKMMGIGPVKAVPVALARAGVTLDQIDVIESNEAFAAQAIAVANQLGFDPAKVNPNGSGIALGHPVGATGAILTVKALYELERTQGRLALITMCIGGGQGIALVLERV